jgi:hypothetical protein
MEPGSNNGGAKKAALGGYAILTFRHSRALFNSLPSVRFELDGIALYGLRHDSSVGGAGAQRCQTPTTWARSGNPAVMIYNILRAIVHWYGW